MQPLAPAGDFNLNQFILQEWRQKIQKGLFDEPIGGLEQPVRSATEIAERINEFSRRIGAPFGRLQNELITPLLQRIVYILKDQGRINLPKVNGREIRIHSVSPLGRAQEQQDIMNFDRFMEQMQTRFGPEVAQITIKADEAAEYLSRKWGVPSSLLRTDEEKQQAMNQMQQLMQQQQQMEQQVPTGTPEGIPQ